MPDDTRQGCPKGCFSLKKEKKEKVGIIQGGEWVSRERVMKIKGTPLKRYNPDM